VPPWIVASPVPLNADSRCRPFHFELSALFGSLGLMPGESVSEMGKDVVWAEVATRSHLIENVDKALAPHPWPISQGAVEVEKDFPHSSEYHSLVGLRASQRFRGHLVTSTR
jgi:hypothetical protein